MARHRGLDLQIITAQNGLWILREPPSSERNVVSSPGSSVVRTDEVEDPYDLASACIADVGKRYSCIHRD
jgi:hypothetical protein